MSPLNSRVWRRYGQLRIYVSADNDPVGWFDPRTGQSQLSNPDMHDEFWAAVRAECQRLLAEGHIGEPELPPETSSIAHRDDLARNAPGSSASARARELRRERPLLTSAAAVLGLRTSAQQFAAGARGERTVGRQLNRWAARYGWHVLHAVPVGRRGADIDHVVIGPFGVVTVNTKTTSTAVWVGEYGLTIGGKPVNYLRKSRQEADRASPLLHRATGLEVPVQSAIRRLRRRPQGDRPERRPGRRRRAPTPRALRRWLHKQSPALQPDQVEAIDEAALQTCELANQVAGPPAGLVI